ncbi:MAG: hypothetical protein L6408_07945, partial [Nanoarchaeota archaeon]|nr:hypothetical protein [Nanoarchaeota archaeon]
VPPIIDIVSYKRDSEGNLILDEKGKPQDDKYYRDLLNVINCLGRDAKVRKLRSLKLRGKVAIRDATLIGDVEVINNTGELIDLGTEKNRKKLQEKDASLVQDERLYFKDVRIIIDKDGLNVESLKPQHPQGSSVSKLKEDIDRILALHDKVEIKIYAHRGVQDRGARENTLKAFQDAIDLGCSGIELDTQITKDGRMVVYRLRDLEGKRISEYTLDEIKQVDSEIPSLEEALKLINGQVQVDVHLVWAEGENKEATRELVSEIKSNNATGWVSVASIFMKDINNILMESEKEGINIKTRTTEVTFGIEKGDIGDNLDRFIEELKRLGNNEAFFYKELLTKEMVTKLHSRGMIVVAVGKEITREEIIRLINLGVDGIMLFNPSIVKKVLKELEHFELDETIHKEWDKRWNRGIFMITPEQMERTKTERQIGPFTARLTPHEKKLRKMVWSDDPVDLNYPLDPDMFHFGKISPEEVLVDNLDFAGRAWRIVINASPPEQYASLFVPKPEYTTNQFLDSKDVEAFIGLLSMTQATVMFNSLWAGASVNSKHFQIYYSTLPEFDFIEEGKGIKWVEFNRVKVGDLEEYPGNFLVIQSNDSRKLARATWLAVEYLQSRNIPYDIAGKGNFVVVMPTALERPSVFHGEEHIASPEKMGLFNIMSAELLPQLTYENLVNAIEETSLSDDKYRNFFRNYIDLLEGHKQKDSNNFASNQSLGIGIELNLALQEDVETMQNLALAVSSEYKGEGDFKEEGGYIFGKEEKGKYAVTRFVPFGRFGKIEVADEAYTQPSEEDIRKAVLTYAKDGVKLIGVYHNHSFVRLTQGQKPGPSWVDFDFFNLIREKAVEAVGSENLAKELIGLVIEPKLDSDRFMEIARTEPEKALSLYKVDIGEMMIYPYLLHDEKPVILDPFEFQKTIFKIDRELQRGRITLESVKLEEDG